MADDHDKNDHDMTHTDGWMMIMSSCADERRGMMLPISATVNGKGKIFTPQYLMKLEGVRAMQKLIGFGLGAAPQEAQVRGVFA